MTKSGDLQACPWCPFVGTPAYFDLHIEKHEEQAKNGSAESLIEALAEAKTEIKRLKAQLKERHRDYARTLIEMMKTVKFMHAELENAQHLLKMKEEV